MKKIPIYFVFCICFSVFAQVKNIAVFPFEVNSAILSDSEVETITELYTSELSDTGRVHIVDHINFMDIIEELKFSLSDFLNPSKLILLADKAKIEALSRGKIMKIGTKFYISASLIDIKNAQVLSSAKISFTDLDSIEQTLRKLACEIVQGLSIKVGDIGPGGGIVFYIEGESGFECSEKIGVCDWGSAKSLCASYKGGDESDWRLPTKDELDLIYINLRKMSKIKENELYWSVTENDIYDAWAKDFASGKDRTVELIEKLAVRAVRQFSLSPF